MQPDRQREQVDAKQYDAELQELRRIIRQRRLLEEPAESFVKMAPKECHGRCEQPVTLGILGMTCCTLHQLWVNHQALVRLEAQQRQVIEHGHNTRGRKRGVEVDSPLHAAYGRDFTGTGVLRRRARGAASGDPTGGVSEDEVKGDTEGNLKSP